MRLRLTALVGALCSVVVAGTACAQITTYGYSNTRLGALTGSGGIPPAMAARLRAAWSARVGGAVNAQPLVIDRVQTQHGPRALVIVATEHGAIVGLDAFNGSRLWRRQLGHTTITPDCGSSPDGEFGITGTPVADPHAGRVYAVDVNGLAWALSLRDGRVLPGWPRRVHPRGAAFVWGGLTLSRGWLYVPVASLCDGGRYNGGIVALDTARPSRTRRWLTIVSSDGVFGGGIWGWGGVSVDPMTGDVYAATGNALGGPDEATPHAESVVALSPQLALRQWNDPLAGPFQSTDRDFGTTPILVDQQGCPGLAVAINKDGELFVYNRRDVGSGPMQRLRVATDTATGVPLYGMPAWDAQARVLLLTSPSAVAGTSLLPGIRAYRLNLNCSFSLRWQQPFDYPDAGSPPTVATGVLYLGSGRNGFIRAYRVRDGHPLWARHLSRDAIFAAPAVDRGTLYVAGWNGRVWAFRPR
jgi:outer membrane protein assembly factor BamB